MSSRRIWNGEWVWSLPKTLRELVLFDEFLSLYGIGFMDLQPTQEDLTRKLRTK